MVNHHIPMRKGKKTFGKASNSYEKDWKISGKPSDSDEKR